MLVTPELTRLPLTYLPFRPCPVSQSSFAPDFPAEYRSAGVQYVRHPAHGVQFFAEVPPENVVGQPTRHMAADLQVVLSCWQWWGWGTCR